VVVGKGSAGMKYFHVQECRMGHGKRMAEWAVQESNERLQRPRPGRVKGIGLGVLYARVQENMCEKRANEVV